MHMLTQSARHLGQCKAEGTFVGSLDSVALLPGPRMLGKYEMVQLPKISGARRPADPMDG